MSTVVPTRSGSGIRIIDPVREIDEALAVYRAAVLEHEAAKATGIRGDILAAACGEIEARLELKRVVWRGLSI